ncbi:hypothetical protein VIGAN_09118800 [Vigna angularis var. angularis]|uniref:Uncharacterized protein n=1 Tax=Vigna angularis var. angularis TaxID=157739 RepID=A0A0S3SY05_PHAAN|nr:hypothetical protein VIGAN_09118800 [Vigna angularis var. angularis]
MLSSIGREVHTERSSLLERGADDGSLISSSSSTRPKAGEDMHTEGKLTAHGKLILELQLPLGKSTRCFHEWKNSSSKQRPVGEARRPSRVQQCKGVASSKSPTLGMGMPRLGAPEVLIHERAAHVEIHFFIQSSLHHASSK